MKKLLIYITLCIFLINLCCLSNKNPLDVSKDELPKDPRKFTWTIDTLSYPGSPQTFMRDIWGSSPNNVFAVGHNSDMYGEIYRFNGKEWKTFEVTFGGPTSYWAIYGFTKNDIWAVGDIGHSAGRDSAGRQIVEYKSHIIHYNGSFWSKVDVPDGQVLESIWGSSPDDIWAGGMNTLIHYNGVMWEKYPVYIPPQGVQLYNMCGLSSDDVYMTGLITDVVSPWDSTHYYLYHFNGETFSVIDSTFITAGFREPKFGYHLAEIDGTLYSEFHHVFRKDGNNWTKIYYDRSILGIGGIDAKNLFCVGGHGLIVHYNGQDWQRIIIDEDFKILLFKVWTDGKEVFMFGNGSNQTYIVHGK